MNFVQVQQTGSGLPPLRAGTGAAVSVPGDPFAQIFANMANEMAGESKDEEAPPPRQRPGQDPLAQIAALLSAAIPQPQPSQEPEEIQPEQVTALPTAAIGQPQPMQEPRGMAMAQMLVADPAQIQRPTQPNQAQPDITVADMAQPGASQPGNVQASIPQAVNVQPSIPQVGMAQPGNVQQSIPQAGNAQPSIPQAGNAQPSIPQVGMAQAGNVQPDMAQSENVQQSHRQDLWAAEPGTDQAQGITAEQTAYIWPKNAGASRPQQTAENPAQMPQGTRSLAARANSPESLTSSARADLPVAVQTVPAEALLTQAVMSVRQAQMPQPQALAQAEAVFYSSVPQTQKSDSGVRSLFDGIQSRASDPAQAAQPNSGEIPVTAAGESESASQQESETPLSMQRQFQSAVTTAKQRMPKSPQPLAEAVDVDQLQDRVNLQRSSGFQVQRVQAQPQEPKLAQQLQTGITQNLKGGNGEFTMKLRPEALGEITVRFAEKDGKTQVRIVTASVQTAKLINQELTALRDALRPMQAEVSQAVPHTEQSPQSQMTFDMSGQQFSSGKQAFQNPKDAPVYYTQGENAPDEPQADTEEAPGGALNIRV